MTYYVGYLRPGQLPHVAHAYVGPVGPVDTLALCGVTLTLHTDAATFDSGNDMFGPYPKCPHCLEVLRHMEAEVDTDSAHRVVEVIRKRYETLGLGFDDMQTGGELIMGAIACVCSPGDALWPWNEAEFEYVAPKDPIDGCIAAAVFLCAEADRLMRRKLDGKPITGGLIPVGLTVQQVEKTIDGLRQIVSD